MAKGKAKQLNIPAPKSPSNGNGKSATSCDYYTTLRGVKFTIVGLTQDIIDSAVQSAEYPKCPQYKVVTEAGKEEFFDLNDTNLEDPESPEQTKLNKARWEAYKKAQVEADNRYRDIIMKVMLLMGVTVENIEEEMAKWEKLQTFIGLKLPEDHMERQYLWLKTIAIASAEESFEIMDRIMAKTGVPESRRAQARQSFRNSMEEARKAAEAA